MVRNLKMSKKMGGVLLRIENLRGCYKGAFGIVWGVDGVSLTVSKGERVGIAGESGCGKSTLAKLITGTPGPLLHYEGGKVEIDGIDVWKISPEKLRKDVKCKRMAYVPQAALNSLNPVIRLREFITDLLEERTGRKYSDDEVRKIAGIHFEKLGLSKRVLDSYPFELSGGMMQRAIVAISTLANPKLLIVDEPTSALDVTSQRLMIKMLIELHRKGIVESILAIAHDMGALRQLCDRIAIMYGGKIVEIGKMDEVVEKPLHPYAKGLMASLLPLERQTRHKSLTSLPGAPPDLRNPPPGCKFHPRCERCMDICRSKEPPTIKKDGRVVACWLYRR